MTNLRSREIYSKNSRGFHSGHKLTLRGLIKFSGLTWFISARLPVGELRHFVCGMTEQEMIISHLFISYIHTHTHNHLLPANAPADTNQQP